MKKDVIYPVRMTAEMAAKLKAFANREEVTMVWVIRKALAQYLKKSTGGVK